VSLQASAPSHGLESAQEVPAGRCSATGSTSCILGAVVDSCQPGTPAVADAVALVGAGQDGCHIRGHIEADRARTIAYSARPQGRHHGPPPEAVEACQSAEEGDDCSFDLHDETIDGTCRKGRNEEQALACMPSHPPPHAPQAED